jgi:hypothetical protein
VGYCEATEQEHASLQANGNRCCFHSALVCKGFQDQTHRRSFSGYKRNDIWDQIREALGMKEHIVQAGETPASIAIFYAGCPKCARDLVAFNKHKPAFVHPNGFTTFKELRAGEKLNLPTKWFDGSLDRLPPSYFAALPSADGVTPSTLGDAALGILGDYATLDAATAQVAALAVAPDAAFNAAVGEVAAQIDSSVAETFSGSNPTAAGLAQQVRTATD